MNKNLKVTIIVPGKFHAFYLAKGLQKKNVLEKIITSYPKFLLLREHIQNKLIISIFIKEIIERLLLRLRLINLLTKLNFFINYLFEYISSYKVDYKKINILVSWSGVAEKSFQKANIKNKKIIKILERGSSHIVFQNNILLEEYKILGIKKKPIDKRIIEKEIREYDLADYIFVPSKFSKKTFIENGVNESKILKVPYGTDLNEFNRTDNDPKDFTIISVGQISVRKGSIYLLKAFEDLNLDNSKLILVGNIENDLKDHLEPFLSNPNIIFKSHVKQSKLSDLYNNSHLFVTTSLEEGLAMVQPQAMACGLPIICTTNSGGAEIVDEGTNGFICPIRNVDYLKNKISFFYYNRDKLKNFSENSYKKAREYLSWDNYSQKVYEEYKKLI
tara:strand:+ start:1933 stop:3099 length:1167 start_codon:yes stop_codon:yes gene_type:complete